MRIDFGPFNLASNYVSSKKQRQLQASGTGKATFPVEIEYCGEITVIGLFIN